MSKYLKREAYDRLLKWKQREGHSTLEVSGARQVGKRTLSINLQTNSISRKYTLISLTFQGNSLLSDTKH